MLEAAEPYNVSDTAMNRGRLSHAAKRGDRRATATLKAWDDAAPKSPSDSSTGRPKKTPAPRGSTAAGRDLFKQTRGHASYDDRGL